MFLRNGKSHFLADFKVTRFEVVLQEGVLISSGRKLGAM